MNPAEAKRFQDEFFSKNEGLRGIFEVMRNVPSSSFYVKNLESQYVTSNAHARVTYDLPREEDLVGHRAREFFPDLLAEAYESEDRRVMESGQPVLNEIWFVPHIRGSPRWFISSKAPLFDHDGEVIGLVGLMHPIATPSDQRTYFKELQSVVEYVEAHFVDEITVDKLAEIAGMSVPHFNRRFRKLLRLSPMKYVLSLRIQEAQRLLATTDESVGEIALATGFYDQSHFTKRFRQTVGMTPLAFRKRYRG